MTWARLDDKFHANRKIRRAWNQSRTSLGLHVLAITYAADHSTDGFVDREFVEEKVPRAGERERAVRALEQAGLWHETPDGWLIHDFLDFNDSAAQQAAKRDAKAYAGRLGGRASGQSRREANANEGEADASGLVEAKRTPDPTRPIGEGANAPSLTRKKEDALVLAVPVDPDWQPPYSGLVVPPWTVPPAPPAGVAPVVVVFCFWRDLHEHHDATLTDGRRRAVRKAFAAPYPLGVVLQAVAGGKLDEFLQGKNDQRRVHDDLPTLLKLGERAGSRNTLEHLAAVFATAEPELDEPLDVVARENALGRAAWIASRFDVLDEQAGWVRRHARRLRGEAPRRWDEFVEWQREHSTPLELVA